MSDAEPFYTSMHHFYMLKNQALFKSGSYRITEMHDIVNTAVFILISYILNV